MTGWRRVAPNSAQFAMSALFVATGSLVLLALLLLGDAAQPGAWIATGFVAVFSTLWTLAALRLDRTGCWPFEQLFARLYGARAIWIVLENGTRVQTPLMYMKPPEIEEHGSGFLHQVMSGAMGARFMRSQTNAGEDLRRSAQERCRAALIELRQALVASRS